MRKVGDESNLLRFFSKETVPSYSAILGRKEKKTCEIVHHRDHDFRIVYMAELTRFPGYFYTKINLQMFLLMSLFDTIVVLWFLFN